MESTGGRWLLHIFLFCLLWWILTRGNPASWVVGFPVITVAAFTLERLRGPPGSSFRLSALPGFLAWFLWNSLRGGADVAWRTLQPSMPLQAGFIHYDLSLPPGPARVLLLNCISLLPGTLSADLEGDTLILHALDISQDIIAETGEAERRVQKLFDIDGLSRRG